MSSKPILYSFNWSSPVRAVWFTAKAIGLDLDIRTIDTVNNQIMSPEYIKMNPQHTIPTLDDNGYYLWDSHAICTYLISKYAEDDKYYPKDLQIRGTIDQRLHFDSAILYPRIRALSYPLFTEGCYEFPAEKIAALHEGYDFVEAFLGDNLYMAGNQMTVADFSIITSITQMNRLYAPFDEVRCPKIAAWVERMEQFPGYDELNTAALDEYKLVTEDLMAKNRAAAGK